MPSVRSRPGPLPRVQDLMSPRPRVVGPDATLGEAMREMEAGAVRHLPVVEGQRLLGVISERDLMLLTGWLHERERAVLEAPDGTIRRYMHAPVVTARPTDSLLHAVLRIVGARGGCLPVVRGEELVGMLSELDVLRAWCERLPEDREAPDIDPPLEDFMTAPVLSLESGTAADLALERMRAQHVRHLPVTDEGRLVGILSDRDLRLAIGRGELEGLAVRDLMTRGPITRRPSEPVSRAVEAMLEGRFSAVPLCAEDGALVGIFTMRDALAACTQGLLSAP